MTSSKNNGFTADDIERYHSGTMSVQERHSLEKAALDDPFLADALEGYTYTSTPVDDVAKIQSRLEEKLTRKKIVPFFQTYKWISVAAIVLIIAGAGWLVYSISETGKSAGIAVKQEKDSSANLDNVTRNQPSAVDTVHSSGSLTTQESPVNSRAKTVLQTNEIKDKRFAGTLQKQVNQKKEISENKKEMVAETTAPVAMQNDATGNKSFTNVEQKNVAKNNTSSPEARANSRPDEPQAKVPVNKDMASTRSAVAGKVNNVNTKDSIKNINVVLQPLPADSVSLQEVVVVGYGKQKKSAEKYPHVIIDTLEPAEGFVKFDDYIASHLKTPEEFKMKPVSGEVQLSFDVDNTGQPVNITVVKSLCETCDKEAIRLLKEGPKWKKKKNKKGRVTIKF